MFKHFAIFSLAILSYDSHHSEAKALSDGHHKEDGHPHKEWLPVQDFPKLEKVLIPELK